MVQLSKFFGLGELDPIVEEIYNAPQLLPPNPINNQIRDSAGGTVLGSWLSENPNIGKVVFCQYGGSETYFYRGYSCLAKSCSSVCFLIQPQFSCRCSPGDYWEEESHLRRIISSLSEEQPLLIIFLKNHIYDLHQMKKEINYEILKTLKTNMGCMIIDLETGDGIGQAMEWLSARCPPAIESPLFDQCSLI